MFVAEVQQPKSDLAIDTEALTSMVLSPEGLTVGIMIIILGLLSLTGDNKNKLANSTWGTAKQKQKVAKRAKKQIKNPQLTSAALYIGTPDDVAKQSEAEFSAKFKKEPDDSSAFTTLHIPDMERSILVAGAAGSGKTYSVINPALQSALDQGFPIMLWDFHYPNQSKAITASALKRGYKVRILAPGRAESEVCNICNFIKNSQDSIGAGQLTRVINRNTDISKGKRGSDPFFETAGLTFVEGIFLLTKLVAEKYQNEDYADLVTASAIINLPNIAKRIGIAQEKGLIPVWTRLSLSQMLAVKDSEKTIAGIIATAQNVFNNFTKKDFMSSLCGRTTLPPDIKPKELIIFGADKEHKDIVVPILGAIYDYMVMRNLSQKKYRKIPLVVCIDELPTLYLPNLVNWLTQNRQDGFCGILGFQHMSQLEDTYGKSIAEVIIGNAASKFIFNPQDYKLAKYFSDFLGETQVKIITKSRTSGGREGRTTTRTEHYHKKPLFEPTEFNQLDRGWCVAILPASRRRKKAYVPLLKQIIISPYDENEREWSKSRWDAYQKFLIQQKPEPLTDAEWDRTLQERMDLVAKMFPDSESTNETGSETDSETNGQTNGNIDLEKEPVAAGLPKSDSLKDVASYQEELGSVF